MILQTFLPQLFFILAQFWPFLTLPFTCLQMGTSVSDICVPQTRTPSQVQISNFPVLMGHFDIFLHNFFLQSCYYSLTIPCFLGWQIPCERYFVSHRNYCSNGYKPALSSALYNAAVLYVVHVCLDGNTSYSVWNMHVRQLDCTCHWWNWCVLYRVYLNLPLVWSYVMQQCK